MSEVEVPSPRHAGNSASGEELRVALSSSDGRRASLTFQSFEDLVGSGIIEALQDASSMMFDLGAWPRPASAGLEEVGRDWSARTAEEEEAFLTGLVGTPLSGAGLTDEGMYLEFGGAWRLEVNASRMWLKKVEDVIQ